ncbi:hypothetical protein CLV51_103634 [Chitinophaga niastensis]|uniref:MoxR-vWA-beta-propeller ternary system domain-containing protein n=1 Tax=Chitinophaga niastensis TaxID=536980 RepID=A0A2P8HKA9_CHINA|nr:hypothetical protein [Chitinophaga niastensis]PSL46653.1 hypothetical protein CLV51_103634 [Chitinophaga niastensis]
MTRNIKEIVMQLPADKYATLGAVRCLPGLLAAVDDDVLWLRGIPFTGKPDPEIRRLPATHTFLLDETNLLFPTDSLTPVATLKSLHWKSLPELLQIVLPVSAMPAEITAKYQVQLAPAEKQQTTHALLTTLTAWCNYAETAPLIRLQPLTFAASDKNEVLIMGQPLPPIPGKEYVLQHKLLLPAGYEFNPAGIAFLVAAKLNPQQEDYLIFDATGTWECIPATAFVKAGRSAIRLTKRERENG